MLVAHQAVGAKIADVKSTIGNSVTITPAGFNSFSDANNALTTTELSKVSSLAHVTKLTEQLTDRLVTIGSAQPSFGRFGGQDSSNSNAQTDLKSPITIDSSDAAGSKFRVFVNGGGNLPANFSVPIPIIGTTDPASLDNNNAIIKSGTMIDGSKDSNDAMVSTDMASKNSLKVGSTFTAYGQKLTVSGIFDTSNQAANSTVVVSLPALQRLTGQTGDVTSAIATADSLDNLASVTAAIKTTLGTIADVQSAQDEANAAVQPLENVQGISAVSLVGTIVAGSAIILMTMIMIVRERRREIGILKAIGASNTRIILQFMSEALTLTVLGAVIGVVIGVAGSSPVTNTLISSSVAVQSGPEVTAFNRPSGMGGGFRSFGARPVTGNFFQRGTGGIANTVRNVTVNVGWSILAYGLGAALVIAAAGSSFAGWMIARVKPYEVMRME